MITTEQYFTLFIATFILVGALTPLMRKIALKYNFVDQPGATHKSHEQARLSRRGSNHSWDSPSDLWSYLLAIEYVR